ncbi:phosphoribosylaminoimidazolesuccinocarboxamide synthase [Paraliomyxa miuraensis]|uniref:phosphoribosylaminoimidazolesuccinocarboxamide synthase n=1 Tax=Paraliomyxa miuraensis TaxID=376150 RepID=UPI002258D30C|nr:phosphoribosylaminoimidazolesuccinocarboxamide synthase [Paraliomyxa miuraensis]MCX4244622.1 phosphoribosylaminoimidazolesuccinocarboxamide synthase [Paraliomyxa miuraensis]
MPVADATLRAALAPGGALDVLPAEFDALGGRYSGKVRENFTRDGVRTIVVTDRISAFDRVLGTIPFKGQVLNQLAAYWFRQTASRFPNHLREVCDPQAMRVVECEPIPIEMVVRGYLTGVSSTSIWRAYERGDRVFCGHALPDGLRKHQRLPSNVVTPSTKAPKGEHDVSVSKDELFVRGLIEPAEFERLEARALELFAFGQRLAAERGLILVDTKYELGRASDGTVVLIDEIHTPDSSRYWYAEGYEAAMAAGEDPRSLDKEYVRRWLVSQGFAGDGPPPALTDEVRLEAARRYIEAFEQVTGESFEPDLRPPLPRLRENLGL